MSSNLTTLIQNKMGSYNLYNTEKKEIKKYPLERKKLTVAICRMKSQTTDWVKRAAKHICDKEFVSRILKSIIKNRNNLSRKWATDTKRHFTEEDRQIEMNI